MAKKRRKRRTGAEVAIGDFAQEMGRILGTAENKARSWLDQRKSIATQLTQVRDKADSLLRELSGGAASLASAATGKRRGRPPGSGKKKTAKKRGRTFTAAQRKEQAERMRAYWANKKKTGKKSRKKAAKGGGEVGNG